MTWEKVDLVPGLGPVSGLMDSVRAIAETTSAALAALEPLIDGLQLVLGAVEGESLGLSALDPLRASVATVHVYPVEVYQAYKFPLWSRVVARSLQLSDTSCVNVPYTVLAFAVSSEDAETLLEQAINLRALLGKRSTGVRDLPITVDRLETRAVRSECRPLTDEIPYLGELEQLLSTQVSISAPNSVSVVARAFNKKVSAVEQRIASIRSFLDLVESFDLPDVFVFSGTVDSLDLVSELLLGGDDAPDRDAYVAGSVMLTDPATGALIGSLLGV